jgi:hypothetical protein
MEFESEVYEVNSDGSYRATVEQEIEILKEQARADYGTRRIYYNASAESFKLVKAATLRGDQELAVDSNYIEDKPLASAGAGFDRLNQVLIAYPDVNTGSKTVLKYSKAVREVPFPGFFSKMFRFESNIQTRARTVSIHSELPLFVESHDPSNALQVAQSTDGGKYTVEIKLKKPLFETVVDEDSPSIVSSDKTWIVVSSTRSQVEMVKTAIPKIESVLNSQLPASYRKIVFEAAKQKATVDKINTVTSALAETIRYMGDWRTISGGFIPRPLEVVAQTRFGDCKDFSAATAAILRKLGFRAEIAWVERGSEPNAFPDLPYSEAFNHAIVRVKADGKTLWIDPTNLQSFAQGIFPDIIGRKALVLDASQDRLTDAIPAGRPNESIYKVDFTLAFDKSGKASLTEKFSNIGRMAISMTASELRYSKQTIDRILATSGVVEAHIIEAKVDAYELKSRIVRDLSFGVKLKTKNSSSKTSAGLGYPLPVPGYVAAMYNLRTSDRDSDFFLAQPMTYDSRYSLRNIHVVGGQYRGCKIKSSWMNISRSFRALPDGLEVVDTYQILSERIRNHDIRGVAFREFQTKLQECFDRIQIIFTPLH